jgi:hypothetical protein
MVVGLRKTIMQMGQTISSISLSMDSIIIPDWGLRKVREDGER